MRIAPMPDEIEHILGVARTLITRVDASGMAGGMIVGSVARNTWVRGDRDLDIFMLFDPALDRTALEVQGLSLARKIASECGATYREKYAEHPYINVKIDGLDVDLVPCYRVSAATEIQSAVDRTPFHTRYIKERIIPHVSDVLLLKQFAKAGGVYGSDQMTEGFSGYLCELLVLHYGGFHPLLERAAEWRPGILIDIEHHQQKEFSDPLIVIDPVDPKRNVSASVSPARMFEFVELARGYLENPSPEFFFAPVPRVLSREELKAELDMRGTHLYAITLNTPPYIEDIVVPQLRRSMDAIRSLLERHDFVVNRADCAMFQERCILVFELLFEDLPSVKRHTGPPLWNRANAEKFAAKYEDLRHIEIFAGPYIEDGKYIVEIKRPYTRVPDLLRSHQVLDVGLGKHVKQVMEEYWDLTRDDECWSEEFAPFMSRFVRYESPLIKIKRLAKGIEDRPE
jgi:tRNA nucleotidyltransferase (CCA-adding enzyme)